MCLFLEFYDSNLLIHLFVYFLGKCFIFLYLKSWKQVFTKEILDLVAWKCPFEDKILPNRERLIYLTSHIMFVWCVFFFLYNVDPWLLGTVVTLNLLVEE